MNEYGRDRLLLSLVLVAFFIAGLVILPVPFTRDQGIYAYVGWGWLNDFVPYKDAFGHKGPLLYAIYALGLSFAKGAMWGINLFDLIARTLTIALVYVTGRELMPRRSALYAALFTALPLWGIFNSCWWNAQAETFMMPLLIASVWLCVRKEAGLRLLLIGIAGFIAAQAVMLKPTAVIHALFFIGWLGVGGAEPGFKGKWKIVICFLSGLIAGIAPWIIYFAAKGALGQMGEWLLVFNSFHVAASLEVKGSALAGTLLRGFWRVFYIIPAAVVFLFIRNNEQRKELGFILGWTLACFFTVLIQARFFLYHWLVLIPAMGLVAGAGMESLHLSLSRWKGDKAGRAITTLVIIWLFLSFGRIWLLIEESYRTRDYLLNRITLSEYYARFSEDDEKGVGDFDLLASVAAANYAHKHTKKNGRVLVFGYEPIVNYLAARVAPTRFQIDYPLTFKPLSEKAVSYSEKWRAEFMADLERTPPEMVIILDNDKNAIEPESSLKQAREFSEFWFWLNKNFTEAEVIEDFHFYRRK